MSKKLLSEAQVRRFAKLAHIPAINEDSKAKEYRRKKGPHGVEHRAGEGPDGHYKDYEGPSGGNKGDDSLTDPGHIDYSESRMNEEDAIEDVEAEVDTALPDGEEVDMAAGEEEIVDTGEEGGEMDLGSREEMAMDVISAVADALNIEVDIDGGEEVEDVEVGDEVSIDAEEGGDLEMGDTAEVEDEEEMMLEALRGINYIPGRKEIVNEVAKRVAKRLLKAKKAEQALQEALGGKTQRRTPQRKTTTAKRRMRPTRNARRRTKK
tara:strand:- start:1186 stop:1980 length:795 start_codon:yes stop_codon:yes gene_type:complete